MVDAAQMDWQAIDSDPKFQELHRKKTLFLWGLMIFSIVSAFFLGVLSFASNPFETVFPVPLDGRNRLDRHLHRAKTGHRHRCQSRLKLQTAA